MADGGMAEILERIRQTQGVSNLARAQRLMQNPILRQIAKVSPGVAETIGNVGQRFGGTPTYAGVGTKIPRLTSAIGGGAARKAVPILGAAYSIGKDVADVSRAASPDQDVELGMLARAAQATGIDQAVNWAMGIENTADEQMRQANQQARLHSTGAVPMGPGAMEGEAAVERAKRVQAAMGNGAETVGPPLSGAGPAPAQRNEPMSDVYARLGVEPWKAQEWKKQAMADPQGQSGPFAVREGGGGFIFGAQPPDVSGMGPDEFSQARAQHSPAVQRLMDERLAALQAHRAQAAAIEQSQAQTGALEAEAQLRGQQARATGREALTLPQQLDEQMQAYNKLLAGAMGDPKAPEMVAQMMREWMQQNPEASQEEMDEQRQHTERMVGALISPEFRDMLQSMDPRMGLSTMRGAGLMPAGGGGL